MSKGFVPKGHCGRLCATYQLPVHQFNEGDLCKTQIFIHASINLGVRAIDYLASESQLNRA